MTFKLSRRAVLRGGGAAIGLPLLDAMLDGRGRIAGRAEAAPGTPSLCLVTFCVPNGVHDYKLWKPATTGPGYALPDWLGPMAPHKGDFTLITGLPKQEAWLNQNINNDAHIRATGTFASGEGITRTGAGGISFDQVVANHIGTDTKFKSLPVAIGKVSDPRWSYLSWAAANQPVPSERDPEVLFRRLFGAAPGGAPGQDSPLGRYRTSVLDYVKADIARLQARAGAADRRRLAQHLTGVRELENQIAKDRTALAACAPPPAPGATPALSNERAQLMMRLMVTALACDLTRVASFQLASRADERQFTWLGIKQGHHGVSHLDDPVGRSNRLKILIDEMEQLAFLLKLMKETPSAGGTLFDRSVVFWANEHGDGYGDGHYMGDMPVIVSGRARGRLKLGTYLKPSKSTYSNVFVTLFGVFGMPNTEFGAYGRATIEGLAA
jgi:hypothetical protein